MNLKINVGLLMWSRIKKEPYLWILLIICFYAVSAYYFDAIRIPSPFSIEIAENINSIAFNLSISYISGMFFYILSVFLPHIRKAHSVLRNLLEDLRLFKDYYYSFLSICGTHEYKDDKAGENLFKDIARFEYSDGNSMPNIIILNDSFVSIAKEYMENFDSYLNLIMARYDFLTNDEFDQLTEIRNSASFSQIRHHFGNNSTTLYSPMKLLEFCGNFVEMYSKTVKLHGDMIRKYVS